MSFHNVVDSSYIKMEMDWESLPACIPEDIVVENPHVTLFYGHVPYSEVMYSKCRALWRTIPEDGISLGKPTLSYDGKVWISLLDLPELELGMRTFYADPCLFRGHPDFSGKSKYEDSYERHPHVTITISVPDEGTLRMEDCDLSGCRLIPRFIEEVVTTPDNRTTLTVPVH